jgi:hypothetical protein
MSWPVSFPLTSGRSIDAPTPLMHKEIQRGQKSVDDEFQPIQVALAERRCTATASAIDVAICSSGPRKPIRRTGGIARSGNTNHSATRIRGRLVRPVTGTPSCHCRDGKERDRGWGERLFAAWGRGAAQRGAPSHLLGRDSPGADYNSGQDHTEDESTGVREERDTTATRFRGVDQRVVPLEELVQEPAAEEEPCGDVDRQPQQERAVRRSVYGTRRLGRDSGRRARPVWGSKNG